MTSSIRFDKATEARLARVTRRRRVTKSAYVREAVESALNRDENQKSAFQLLEPWIGKFDLGDPELSQRDPGEIIRAKFAAKHGRRPR